jgi:hypothetical protein
MSSTTVHIYVRILNLCKKTKRSAAGDVDVHDLIIISIKEVGKEAKMRNSVNMHSHINLHTSNIM